MLPAGHPITPQALMSNSQLVTLSMILSSPLNTWGRCIIPTTITVALSPAHQCQIQATGLIRQCITLQGHHSSRLILNVAIHWEVVDIAVMGMVRILYRRCLSIVLRIFHHRAGPLCLLTRILDISLPNKAPSRGPGRILSYPFEMTWMILHLCMKLVLPTCKALGGSNEIASSLNPIFIYSATDIAMYSW